MQPGLLILLPKKTYNIFALPFRNAKNEWSLIGGHILWL